MRNIGQAALCAVLVCLAAGAAVDADPVDNSMVKLQLTPDQVDVGIFYRGVDVQVNGDIPACDGAVLVLEDEGEHIALNRKGRKAGIWLNVATVTISGAPGVYILASSNRLEDLCSEDVRRELGLGIDAIRDRMNVASEKLLAGTEAGEFLKFKTKSGRYKTDIHITLTPTSAGREELSAVLPIPANVPPGKYRVDLYCFAEGRLVSRGLTELSITRVGVAHLMASLAYEKPALYGALAVLIAMVVGIAMGVVFHSLPGSGH